MDTMVVANHTYMATVVTYFLKSNVLYVYFLGGLHKHFEECKCILEYMTKFPDQKECIFSNFIVLFLHVFKGLQYLHNRNIVHGDIKGLYNKIYIIIINMYSYLVYLFTISFLVYV